MRGFRLERGAFVAELDEGERAALAAVVSDVAALLGPTGTDAPDAHHEDGAVATSGPFAGLHLRTSDIEAPTDAAIHRLLPDASRDDPAVSAEFRRLTEDDLRSAKTAGLVAFREALEDDPEDGWPDGALVVPPERAAALAATLTDVRLVLAERLGLRDDDDSDALYDELESEEPADDDELGAMRRYVGSIYAALSWLQESLLAALLEDLDSR